jgi:hypothetical protein
MGIFRNSTVSAQLIESVPAKTNREFDECREG